MWIKRGDMDIFVFYKMTTVIGKISIIPVFNFCRLGLSKNWIFFFFSNSQATIANGNSFSSIASALVVVVQLYYATLKNENIIWWLDVRSRIHIRQELRRVLGHNKERKLLIFIWDSSRTPQKSDPGGLEKIQNSSVKIEHWNSCITMFSGKFWF